MSASESLSKAQAFTPREIVSELDRYIIGQHEAKRAVAIALRKERWHNWFPTTEMSADGYRRGAKRTVRCKPRPLRHL